jgi:phosphonate transport system substrate-binding protein
MKSSSRFATRLVRAAATAAVVIVSIVTPVLHAAGRPLIFGVAEGKTPGAALQEHEGLLAQLNSSPNLKFTLKTFANYDALYDAMKAKKVDVILIGPVKYVQAHSEIGAVAVASEQPKLQQAMVIVARDSKIQKITDLKGKRFAFGYDGSTSTHLMPLLLLSKYQMAATDLGKTAFLGPQQEKIVEAILSKEFDAGAVTTSVYLENKNRVRLLEASEPFPNGTIVVPKETDAKTIAEMRQLLVNYHPAGAALKQRFGLGAAAVTDADYNKIRFLCKVLFHKSYL